MQPPVLAVPAAPKSTGARAAPSSAPALAVKAGPTAPKRAAKAAAESRDADEAYSISAIMILRIVLGNSR